MRRRSALLLPAVLGGLGAGLLALASDLPASPYGPRAAGVWPFEAGGAAPPFEGPVVPRWAQLSNQSSGTHAAHLLVTLIVVLGAVLLGLAWLLLWRRARADGTLTLRRLWWVPAAWTAPLFAASPFTTQDVWTYGLEGHLVLHSVGGYTSRALVRSVWTSGFDGIAVRPSPYGPGALDLSALFVKLSGGHPWVAAQWWRLAALVGVLLCAWGVHRIVTVLDGNPTLAVLAGVANPAMLVILIGGIHNDALMLGLTVAGVALAVSGAPTWGVVVCALGVAVKPNALLAVAALAWWAWGDRWRPRLRGAVTALAVVVGVLTISGLGVGGGFGWLGTLSANNGLQGPWSAAAGLFGVTTGWPITAIEVIGLVVAVGFVIRASGPGRWVVHLGWAFAALAVTNARPEPWYLAWAVVFLACGSPTRRSERLAIAVLSLMMIGTVLPAGPLWWFSGVVVLLWLGATSLRARRSAQIEPPPTHPSPPSPVPAGVA